MPWSVQDNHPDCEASKPWAVVKDNDGEVEGCHETKEGAEAQQRALYASESMDLDEEELALPMPRWRMLAVDEALPTDDGRAFRAEGVLTWRDPPLAVTWTAEITDGHLGAKLGATADRVERQGSQVWMYGTFTGDESGMELLAHVKAGHPLFPSVTIADEVGVLEVDADGRDLLVFERGKIVGVTLTPEQAQEGTMIELEEEPMLACAAVGGPPLYPPAAWFEAPDLDGVTPLSITEEGRVFGHLAGAGCLLSRPDRCIRVTDDALARDFSVFHKGLDGQDRGIKTAEGTQVKVGQITLIGGHAPFSVGAAAARRHYDDTASVVAHVRAGWDERNNLPWYSGALAHGTTEAQVQALRAAGVSGDWRPGSEFGFADGKVHLIALPAVNVPGFPTVRALVASGAVESFVARLGPREENDMDEGKFQEMHERLHSPEHQRASATTAVFAQFQAGNIQALIDHICAEASSMTDCMAIVEGHVDDPGALCNWMREQCGGEFGQSAEPVMASAWQLALEGLDRRVWEPELRQMDQQALPLQAFM